MTLTGSYTQIRQTATSLFAPTQNLGVIQEIT